MNDGRWPSTHECYQWAVDKGRPIVEAATFAYWSDLIGDVPADYDAYHDPYSNESQKVYTIEQMWVSFTASPEATT